MKKTILLFGLVILFLPALAQKEISGQVFATTTHKPIAGAVIRSKKTNLSVQTDLQGKFTIVVSKVPDTLVASFVGFNSQFMPIRAQTVSPLEILLNESIQQLQEVVLSTGFQTLSKERATGSFSQVSNSLLNRSISTDLISRIADVVPGLIQNRVGTVSGNNQTALSIRGQSTLSSRSDPLIVLDNFPYEGDIANINPNDVESVTVLKDAAASSIWGARSGKGVIVITTKKGKLNQPTMVTLNANLTIGGRPDVKQLPVMSSSDYIDVEKLLFSRGLYTTRETSPEKPRLSPVVELLIARRDGKISQAVADAQIDALRNIDFRDDYTKYVLRPAVNQQYALNLSGGGATSRYSLSAGLDKNLSNLRENSFDRKSLNGNHTYLFLQNKLELNTALWYSESRTALNNGIGTNTTAYNSFYPYSRLKDDSGNNLPLALTYRSGYTDAAQASGLLNWSYVPLDEIQAGDNSTKQTDYRLNASLRYRILPELHADLLYQYSRSFTDAKNIQTQDSYYTRDLINRYTIAGASGNLIRPIPLGGVYDDRLGNVTGQNLRAILGYDKIWNADHEIHALAGAEVSDRHTLFNQYRLYGYDSDHASSLPVDYSSFFTSYVNPASTNNRIPNQELLGDQTDRYLSYYGNLAYTYKSRYTVSGSARLDQSNLFGVNTNQKGVPLYSAGLAWDINREKFYEVNWLPRLKVRATYGYNGNVNKSLSSYVTAFYFGASSVGLPYAQIINPPNPDLRWERVENINLGLDFVLKNNIISGSIDLYRKRGKDLIGTVPYAPQTGILTFTGNTASTDGKGFDLTLNASPLSGPFQYNTTFLLSHINEKVTRYLTKATAITSYLNGGYTSFPTEGKPLYAIYSYPWAGLDPLTGDPQGYLNGQISKNYSAIRTATNLDNVIYNGPARPVWFGSWLHTVSYKGAYISTNVVYRLGYYFRRESVNYDDVLTANGGHSDYALRWQKPGDELITNVPSLPAATNSTRNSFYANSEVLVEKGDHIRLQDITAGYDFDRKTIKSLPFRHVRLNLYISNLGILWKATHTDLDPDYPTRFSLRPPKTYALGLKMDL